MPIIETKVLNFKTKEIQLTYADLISILSAHEVEVPDGAKLQILYQSKSKVVEGQDMVDGDKILFRYTILEVE